ncbi:MAG TPA: hypothetical protein VK034_31420, partial [Enhygromyxa sp.]|nr:hypothetical protein [Enhygromyxa sp.]
MMSNKRAASLATSLILLGCGGRTVSAGEDETGSTDTNELRSCEGPNAPSDPVELVGGEMQPGTFVRVGQRIYWADAWDEWSDEQPATTLYRTDLAAGEPWVAVAVDQPGINELVATADAIYWVVEGLSQPGGSLLRANLDDEIEILDDGLLSPRALTVGDANEWIYYVEGGDLAQANAKVLRIRPDGSSRQVIADSVGQIEDLAVDESHVWWVTPVTFEVWRADKGGGEVELIAELPNPAQIEVQGGFAWTLGLTGLYRISAGGEPD